MDMCQELEIATVKNVQTVKDIQTECKSKGNLLKKYLNQFDLILLDDRLSLLRVAKELGSSETLLRKRHFPMPVQISNKNA